MLSVYVKKTRSYKILIYLLITSILISLIPIQKVKASTQISAWTDFTRTYNGYNYRFYTVGELDPPQNYSFNSDVIDYVIETVGKAQRYQIENRSEIVPISWAQEQTENLLNWVFGAVVNAYTATGSLIHDYVNSSLFTYSWDFSFTGSDENYPGWDTYGTAYGFTFKGACGDIIDLVLDSQGNFYGHNPLGNYTINPDPEPYNWILINQGLDNFYCPTSDIQNFSDLDSPYIKGKELHFFVYKNGTKFEYILNDFTETSISLSRSVYNNQTIITLYFFSSLGYRDCTINGSSFSSQKQVVNGFTINNQNTTFSGSIYRSAINISTNTDNRSFSLPFYNGYDGIKNIGNYDELGILDNNLFPGSGNIYLKSFSYNPNTNPNPIPEDPIPITSIPDDPEDPIPQTNPDPVPGISYPEPAPLPLPPFATIVSGNDDLWGLTVDLNTTENSLLPYLNSLATFEFPSFDSLISDFSGSIIWVAQIMSVLYNGTSFNILFIVLCLFSLVSIIIGGYKLWSTTEPDPNNPGFRRTKKPPKGPKGRRRR